MNLRSALCLLALPLLAAAASAADYEVSFERLPAAVAEGQPFEVALRYKAAAPARLHCEMKDMGVNVLEGPSEPIEGAGVQRFTLHAPMRTEQARVQVAIWIGEDWRAPLSAISHSDPIRVLSAGESAALAEKEAQVADLIERTGYRKATSGNIAIVDAGLPGVDPALVETYADALAAQGCAVTRLDAEAITNPFFVTADRFDVLVLVQAATFPAECAATVQSYAEAGGDLVVLGGPAFHDLVWRVGEEWVNRDSLRSALARQVGARPFLTFDGALGEWRRSTNAADRASRIESEQPGANGTAGCGRISIEGLSGWDTFDTTLAESPFGPGEELTTLWAKGDDHTSQLSVEWRERDGSRWIAVIALSTEWQPYALMPEDFKHWHDDASGRGGTGDRFRPENAASLCVGLAFTHTEAVAAGDHTIRIDEVGTAAFPAEQRAALLASLGTEPPVLEGISPSYKLYPVEGARTVEADPRQALWSGGEAPITPRLMEIHQRPQGTVFEKSRRWRWVPLLKAIREDGRLAGFPAALVVNGREPFRGGLWLSIPTPDSAFLGDPSIVRLVSEVVPRMLDGFFLYEGGTDAYVYRPGEAVTFGAAVANFGPLTPVIDLRITATAEGRDGPLFTATPAVTLGPDGMGSVAITANLGDAAADEYTVRTELWRDGKVIDRLEHTVATWRPEPNPSFVTTAAGDFLLEGRKWYPYGVNYMPSSGVGIEDGAYFERWLDPQPYDPEIIQWDLEDCKRIGFNCVSVFIYRDSLEARNLWDLLLRCERLGLKVNLSLRPGTPMHFLWNQMREIIEFYGLAECDTVFAYDLAWEPFFGNYNERCEWDPDWRAWVDAKYGSLDAAQAEWGYRAPLREDLLTGPSDEQLAGNGAWTRFAVDYRDFVDDLVGAKYAEARRLVRTIDPNHPVSFRMTVAGDPTFGQRPLPYDLKGLAGAVDIMEPEGYGRLGEWEQVRPGWFTAAYARAVAPDLPVLWAEYGYTVWDRARMQPNPDTIEWTTRFYRNFLDMTLRSGANGAICWWFPGGFRVGENSDFGILNPDRSWRPYTEVLHEYAGPLTQEREIPRPDVWIDITRTGHADGIKGIYDEVKERFWQAVDEGKTPGLRWTPAQ